MQFCVEEGQLVVAEGARSQRYLVGLPDERSENPGMAMALVDGGIGGQAIEIALAVHVVYPDAFGTLDDHIERTIVVGAKTLFQRNQLFRVSDFGYGHGVSCFVTNCSL